MIYMTSDQHFSHSNIIRFCNRPFKNREEMDEAIIKNHNSIVKPNDIVYHLGDISMANYKHIESLMKRLNGKKHIIMGNHDKPKVMRELLVAGLIESFQNVLGIGINGQYIWMSHYPHRSWNRSCHGSWHCFAHVHGRLNDSPCGNSYDVGVDNNNYFPISFDQLSEIMAKLQKNNI